MPGAKEGRMPDMIFSFDARKDFPRGVELNQTPLPPRVEDGEAGFPIHMITAATKIPKPKYMPITRNTNKSLASEWITPVERY